MHTRFSALIRHTVGSLVFLGTGTTMLRSHSSVLSASLLVLRPSPGSWIARCPEAKWDSFQFQKATSLSALWIIPTKRELNLSLSTITDLFNFGVNLFPPAGGRGKLVPPPKKKNLLPGKYDYINIHKTLQNNTGLLSIFHKAYLEQESCFFFRSDKIRSKPQRISRDL